METMPTLLDPGMGVVLVEFQYEYEGRDGAPVRILPNERYELLMKTTSHWWQVRSGPGAKPFYVPAKYVRQLPQVPALCPALCLPGTEATPNASHSPTLLPVPVPVLPKTQEEARKPSDQVGPAQVRPAQVRPAQVGPAQVGPAQVRPEQVRPDQVVIQLRANGGGRRSENRMSTFGVPLETEVSMPTPRTTNNNMADSHRDSGKQPAPSSRHQPILVETPRAPPTHDDPPQETAPNQEVQEERPQGITPTDQEDEPEKLPEEPSDSEEEPPEQRAPPQEREENCSSSHIYESIQDLHLDLDTLIGPDARKEEEFEAPPPAQESKLDSPIYANVSKHVIPPPPADPAPPPPVPAHSVSGSSSSGLSPASPLSPLDEWQGAPWERLVDEVSGRFYFFNPTTGATSWTLPEPQGPASSSSCPQLPEKDYPHDQEASADDSVFTASSPPSLPRAPPESKPEGLLGNGVSEASWRHSVAEGKFFPVRRHVSDLTDRSKGHAPDSLQLPDRLRLRRNLSNRSAGEARQPHGHQLEKAGIINKTKVCDNGKKIRKNWSQSWTVLHGGILTFHRDPKSAPSGAAGKASQIMPEFTVDLRGASVSWANHKSSKKNVLELKTRSGCEFLIQYDTESIISDWFKVISDAIGQLDGEGSEDSDDSDPDENKSKRNSSRVSSSDSDQRRVRHKLRRFLQRRPTLQSVKEKGYIRDAVFGCHLDTLCHRENAPVPRFVHKCVRYVERHGLDTDGIYRVSGNLAVIQRLRHKADHEEHLDLEDGSVTEVHVVTGALKLFFRELPEPLFPFSEYDKFIAAIQLSDYSQRVSYIKDLVQTLPLPNHSTMELLFRHLRRVVDHKEQNRMSVQSLAIVLGPTLLRPQVESNMTVNMVFQSRLVELMLQELVSIFPPPKTRD